MTDDKITVETPAGPITVGRNSPAAYALDPARWAREDAEQLASGRMQWSLGSELADLLWMAVPESRSALVALVGQKLSDGEEYDSFLTPPTPAEVAGLAYVDVLVPALSDQPGQQDVVLRTLAVLRRVIAKTGRGVWWEAIDDWVIRALERNGHAPVLEQLDAELMELVRETRRRLGQE